MKRTFVLILVVAIVMIAVGVAIFMLIAFPKIKEQAEVRKMTINDVEFSKVKDGAFRGDFTYGNFTYEVEVTVQEHKISRINILRNRSDSDYARKAEGVTDRVINAQSLKVNAVTGATTTSKALLKAIQNALVAGLERDDTANE
jgi:uncharacterized protein with FMN-binding domain